MEQIVKIRKIKKLNRVYDRYDLTVSTTNNFYANNILIHNTSSIIGKLHVKEPKKIAIHKWLWNKFVDGTGLFKSTRFIDYNVVYGPVYSSRTVIKNRYINKGVNSGFYSQDIWSEYGDIVYPYLDQGMTIYGEIVGYLTSSESMIQKLYDYGCKVGENKLMIYRITTINDDGSKKEWEIDEVYNWTLNLIERMKEKEDSNHTRIHPIDILYHGTLEDLYPELNPEEHWREELLKKMKNDKEHFHMEELDPICKNEVPFEGICIRVVDSPIPMCYKLKTAAFDMKFAVLMDAGDVDMEMLQGYYNDNQEENQ